MSNKLYQFLFVCCFLGQIQLLQAQTEKRLWSFQNEGPAIKLQDVLIKASEKKLFTLDIQQAEFKLKQAPIWREADLRSYGMAFQLPDPQGNIRTYHLANLSNFEAPLAAKYPEIQSFTGIGPDGSVLKLDISPKGLRAMVLGHEYTYFIDPYLKSGVLWYMVYDKKHYIKGEGKPDGEEAPIGDVSEVEALVKKYRENQGGKIFTPNGATKRTYRIAIAASKEYTNFHGGTVPLALAAQNTTMNRVNGVYERDFAVRMNIVANNNLIIYTNANPGPYTNQNDAGVTINQNQTNITSVIGTANFDIGHIFTTGAGGLAGLGVVCNSGNKARGVTGIAAPVGDPFDIDYVAHEIGHQFDCTHTFNGSSGSCSGNRSAITAYEPGSGTTIMAYAGICAPQDIQPNSDDHFHTSSYEQAVAFITSGGGNTCPVSTVTNNAIPVVNAGPNFVIPRNTPFTLTGSASDANSSDTLTYCWEQYDLGPQGPPNDATSTTAPIFRSFSPTLSPSRTFPRWQNLLAGTTVLGEILPNVSRTMIFILHVRDNKPGNGAGNNDTMSVTVASSNPFLVTAPNTAVTWNVFSSQTVTWDRASTHLAPISTDSVRILLSIDGGLSWPIVLANATPNDGSEQIVVPNNPSNNCRVMVMARNNIYFDVSNVDFTIPVPTIPDFNIGLLQSSRATCINDSALFRLRVNSILGFSAPVSLSISGLAANTFARFETDTVIPSDTIDLWIRAQTGAAAGNTNFTITAVGSSGTKTAQGTITVVTAVPVAPTLVSPAVNAPNVPLKPGFSWNAVPGAITYQLQLASDIAFNNIVASGTNIPTTGFVSPVFLIGNTNYYWRVRAVNPCGIGPWSGGNRFITENVICVSFSNTTAVTIPVSGTITSTIEVPAGNLIRDVNVRNIRGTHGRVNDLRISILSASGILIPLMPQNCSASAQNFYISFDQAAPSGSLPCPPTDSLTYQPSGNLNLLNNEIACGTWTLIVTDTVSGIGGTLQGWDLDICYEACQANQFVSIGAITPSTTLCQGQFNTISVNYVSPTNVRYRWRRNGVDLPGQSGIGLSTGTLTLNLPNITLAQAGNYDVVISNCCGPDTSDAHVLTINPTPPTPTVIQVGNSLQSSSASGNQWFRNGVVQGGQTNQTFTPVVNGNYTVVVTINGCSSSPSAPFAFTVTGLEATVFEEEGFTFFPNPATDQLVIAFQGLEDGEELKGNIRLLTTLGQEIVTFSDLNLGAKGFAIPVQDFATGMYLLQVEVNSVRKVYKWNKQ